MSDDFGEMVLDGFGWQDEKGNRLMVTRQVPDDLAAWADWEKSIEPFAGQPWDVIAAELSCSDGGIFSIEIGQAEDIALQLAEAVNLRKEGVSLDALTAVYDWKDGSEIEFTPSASVPTDLNPLHRACDADRSIPMG